MTNYSVANLSVQQLRQVLAIREQIEALEAQLASLLGSPAPASAVPKTKPVKSASVAARKRGGISAAGRARIAAAQKARWAKLKAKKVTISTLAPASGKAKRSPLSPEGRARIVAAQKARWAKVKGGKK